LETKQAIEALGALAQETRLAIFRLLVEAGPDGLSAGTIGERLGVHASSLSFHLAHLTRAGLLVQRRASRSLIYTANFPGMNALVSYLTENCCGGNPAACMPSCAPAAAKSGGDLDETPARARRRR
jgi:ArsR family transcriptional regulator, arsenate/arsenite/antimonite-responsive transcriptional repressor